MPIREQLATDQTGPWQVVPRQVFTPYDCLLISVSFVVLSRVGCLWVTGLRLIKLQSVAINVTSNFEFPLTYVYFHVYFLIFCR